MWDEYMKIKALVNQYVACNSYNMTRKKLKKHCIKGRAMEIIIIQLQMLIGKYYIKTHIWNHTDENLRQCQNLNRS